MADSYYKGWIYGIGTYYSRSYSLGSMSRVGLTGTDADDIRDWVYALNKLVQRQLEEVDRRYMELYQRHKKEKEQWT